MENTVIIVGNFGPENTPFYLSIGKSMPGHNPCNVQWNGCAEMGQLSATRFILGSPSFEAWLRWAMKKTEFKALQIVKVSA